MKFSKIASVVLGLAFGFGVFAAGANAQPGRARWEGNNGRHRGWETGRHRGWDRDRSRRWDRERDRYGYGNSYYYQRRSRDRYSRYGSSSIRTYGGILGGRNYGYNSRYYGNSNGYYGNGYLTPRQRRHMRERYERERRRENRRYRW